MKKTIKILALLVGGFAFLISLPTNLRAAAFPHFQFDEFGHFYENGVLQAPGTIGVDPISGQSTLAYQLNFPVSRGDVVLFEPGTTNISDILRFGGPGALGTLYFFSDPAEAPGPGNLADNGPLPAPQANASFFTESGAEGDPVQGLFGYAPGPGAPGGISPSTFPTYDFFSEGLAPEPGSLTLLGLGGLLALMRRRTAT